MEPDVAPGAPDADLGDPGTDPEDRVHHHAKLDQVGSARAGAPIRTLCGLVLGDGPRPGADRLPCCPMCGEEMRALGRRCER